MRKTKSFNFQTTASKGRQYNFHRLYKPYMRFDGVEFLINYNRTKPEKENDTTFLAALVLMLEDKSQEAFMFSVYKYDFMAEIFRVRVKGDQDRFGGFRECLSVAVVKARASRERAVARKAEEK